MSALFEVEKVSFAYPGPFPALKELTLNINPSSRVALTGANGSGKSTLLKLLDGLYFPDSGKIRFNGMELNESLFQKEEFVYEFRQQVGFLFQEPDAQLFSPTVWDELCFGPLQLGWPKEKIREKAEAILHQFGLASLRERPPYRLSLGEKKKVALASVLIVDPEVLLLDEPTTALDPRTQSLLLDLLYEWGHKKKTIITSTHDLSTLREVADEVFVLQDGSLVYHGSPAELLANEQLLQQTNLIHIHTHRHADLEHAHSHAHDFHGHPHSDAGYNKKNVSKERN